MVKQAMSVVALLGVCGLAQAQSFVEHFDDPSGGVVPIPATWATVNVSNGGPGTNPNWQVRSDGGATTFPQQAGTGYAFANYNSSTGANPVDNWLVSPIVTWNNGDTIKFWTRTVTNVGGLLTYPDAMQVRLATATTNIGTTQAQLLADFSTLALDINPTLSNNPAPGAPSGNPPTTVGFPDVWTQYTVTVSGLSGPTQGRFAFRYFTPIDGGPAGLYSNYLGVDEVEYTANSGGPSCYANCDNSTNAPCLNVNDFVCFNNAFSAGLPYANCDASTISPVLNVNDFVCFNNKFSAGCTSPCSPHP